MPGLPKITSGYVLLRSIDRFRELDHEVWKVASFSGGRPKVFKQIKCISAEEKRLGRIDQIGCINMMFFISNDMSMITAAIDG
jgi:hypothetical protein